MMYFTSGVVLGGTANDFGRAVMLRSGCEWKEGDTSAQI